MDIILRDCGHGDWLGIVEKDGKETFRTLRHHPSMTVALLTVQEYLEAESMREYLNGGTQ
jgi:hypothetical protein